MQNDIPKELDEYMTLSPSGLEMFTMKAIQDALSGSYICIINQLSYHPSHEEIEALKERLKKQQEKKRARNKCNNLHPICNQQSFGTTSKEEKDGKERQVNIGFHRDKSIVSFPGNLEGKSIIQFATNAPPSVVASIRPMGSGQLLAIITTSGDTKVLKNEDSLEVAIASLSSYMEGMGSNEYCEKFSHAMELWSRHVQQVWSRSSDIELYRRSTESKKRPCEESCRNNGEDSMHGLRSHFSDILKSDSQLKYRASCLRADTKDYKYKRDDLIPTLADLLIPSTNLDDGKTKKFIVDLKKFDFEVVGFVHRGSLVAGISLNYYQHIGARSYCSGRIPPDITQPYISGEISKTVIRLRPSIANLLYHISDIQVGDVVIDPCAGIGTIPVEGSMQKCFTMGGDLALCCNEGLGNIVAEYSKSVLNFKASNRIIGSSAMICWDAALLPLRGNTVDHVISDLPFGLRCMSSKKLSTFLPLLLRDCARCLRTHSGQMTLLCGSYQGILDALLQIETGSPIFTSPTSVIPVNIGGISAWIIKLKRTDVSFVQAPRHREHARAMVQGRSQSMHGTKRAQA